MVGKSKNNLKARNVFFFSLTFQIVFNYLTTSNNYKTFPPVLLLYSDNPGTVLGHILHISHRA